MPVRRALQTILFAGRSPLKVLSTILLTAASLSLAFGLRFDFELAEIFENREVYFFFFLLLLYRLAAYAYWNLHQGYWRHVSTKELEDLLRAHTFSTLAFVSSLLLLRVENMPRSVIIIEFCLSLLFAGGSRFLIRLLCEEIFADAPAERGASNKIVVLGAGNSGHLFIRTLRNNRKAGFQPLLVLDDDERLTGFSIHGVKVKGRTNLLSEVLAENPDINVVVVAIPSISREKLAEIDSICRTFKVALKKLQSFEDIAFRDALSDDGNASLEALLDRPLTAHHDNDVREQLRGKRVLVTGAGGSIGSELVRQILDFEPAQITLFDSSEYNLFRAELEFSKLATSIRKRFVIGSITDRARLDRIFSEEMPEFVFHAAAYKHVPVMESNCSQAFATNVVGTWNVLEASSKANVNRFVLISTDKAIDPSSVMGCSKRIAEWLVQQFSNDVDGRISAKGGALSTAVVRFGNVVNSTGSVVPLFREQILSGGPVTVTHPDIERYFMSIQEAVRLVLTAGTLGQRGEVFVLDMGHKIKIVEIAQRMLRLYGRSDIPIVFTGLRPGEKLTEELIGGLETTEPTQFRKVSCVKAPPLTVDVAATVKDIERRLPDLTDADIGKIMHRTVQLVKQAQKEQRAVA